MNQLEEFLQTHGRWQPLSRYIERMNAFPEDGGIIVGNCKDLLESICKTILEDHFKKTLTGTESIQKLVKAACVELGTLQRVASLVNAFTNLAKDLGELRNRHADTGHGRSMAELEQVPEAITEATSECLVSMTEQIALFLLRVFEHEYPAREESKPLLLNHHLEFNAAFDDIHEMVEIAGYGPYAASEILFSVDLGAYRTELETYKADIQLQGELGELY